MGVHINQLLEAVPFDCSSDEQRQHPMSLVRQGRYTTTGYKAGGCTRSPLVVDSFVLSPFAKLLAAGIGLQDIQKELEKAYDLPDLSHETPRIIEALEPCGL